MPQPKDVIYLQGSLAAGNAARVAGINDAGPHT